MISERGDGYHNLGEIKGVQWRCLGSESRVEVEASRIRAWNNILS